MISPKLIFYLRWKDVEANSNVLRLLIRIFNKLHKAFALSNFVSILDEDEREHRLSSFFFLETSDSHL